MDVALVGKFKHGKLFKLLKERNWNQADLARHLGRTQSEVSSWLRMKSKPKGEKTLCELERLTSTLREDLFPTKDMQIAKNLPDEIVAFRDMDMGLLIESLQGRQLTLEQARDKEIATDMVHYILDCIPPREAFVLRKRYALGSEDKERNYREVAEELGVSHTRVRQIAINALRNMKRHGNKLLLESKEILDEVS